MVSQKSKDFANKRQIKHLSCSLEPSIAFHSLVNKVDSEDFILEKIETPKLSLEINTLPDTLFQTISESRVYSVDPNNNYNHHFKFFSLSAITIIIPFPPDIVDSLSLKKLNLYQSHMLRSFINNLEFHIANIILKRLVIAYESKGINDDNSLENGDVKLIHTLAQTLAQNHSFDRQFTQYHFSFYDPQNEKRPSRTYFSSRQKQNSIKLYFQNC